MPSVALVTWKSVRASRIERLRVAHTALLRTGSGRKGGTTEIQHSLILRLASEFQGFARDLHTEAVSAVLAWLCPGDAALRKVLRLPYLDGRRLDRGNADPTGLAHDFGLLGVEFWHTLGSRHKTARQWQVNLESLNATRNGLIHADDLKVGHMAASGWPPTLRSAERWRASLDQLAVAMDDVIGAYVGDLVGRRPW